MVWLPQREHQVCFLGLASYAGRSLGPLLDVLVQPPPISYGANVFVRGTVFLPSRLRCKIESPYDRMRVERLKRFVRKE